MNFESLESLRLLCSEILQSQAKSLGYFEYQTGYRHLRIHKKRSVSSTATCVLSLLANRKWAASPSDTKELLNYLVGRKKSAGLAEDNPFTTAWILEAVTELLPYSEALDQVANEELARKQAVLQKYIEDSPDGGISMPADETPKTEQSAQKTPGGEEKLAGEKTNSKTEKIPSYPPSAYLTQLVVRVLDRRKSLSEVHREKVARWAWSELARQFALLQSGSKSQDAFAVAYLVILSTSLTPKSDISPEQASIRKTALAAFFKNQLPDGTWPLSRPLFHYPNIGNAYCYEYEMLTQMLSERELQDHLLEFLSHLELSIRSATVTNVYRLDKGIWAWTSGHHPQIGQPESWATASVFHFTRMLDLLLAEAVRRDLFRYLDLPQYAISFETSEEKEFASDVLDSVLTMRGQPVKLKNEMRLEFVELIRKETVKVLNGGEFDKNTPRSAIFYGPPGTSKTDLAKKIAGFLGWPFLSIDPSLLLRHGMDGIQAEANKIFRMLEQTDAVVVLFDEFDELVRERGAKAEQPFSRLLTTSMLPKLARLRKRGTLVFIIATNNISEFDLAISRRGRFDKVFQVLPPSFQEKMNFTKWGPDKSISIKAIFDELPLKIDDDIIRQLGELTFDETDALAAELVKAKQANDPQQAIRALNQQWMDSTMQKKVPKAQSIREEEITWADRCQVEAGFSR